jgi:hypothetical protein
MDEWPVGKTWGWASKSEANGKDESRNFAENGLVSPSEICVYENRLLLQVEEEARVILWSVWTRSTESMGVKIETWMPVKLRKAHQASICGCTWLAICNTAQQVQITSPPSHLNPFWPFSNHDCHYFLRYVSLKACWKPGEMIFACLVLG